MVEELESPYAAPTIEATPSTDWFWTTRLICATLAVSGLVYGFLLLPFFWVPLSAIGYAIWASWISIAFGIKRVHHFRFWCASTVWHAWLFTVTSGPIRTDSFSLMYWHCRIHLFAALTVSIVFLVRFSLWIPFGRKSLTTKFKA